MVSLNGAPTLWRMAHVTTTLAGMNTQVADEWRTWLNRHGIDENDVAVHHGPIVCDDVARTVTYPTFARDDDGRLIVDDGPKIIHVVVQLEARALPMPMLGLWSLANLDRESRPSSVRADARHPSPVPRRHLDRRSPMGANRLHPHRHHRRHPQRMGGAQAGHPMKTPTAPVVVAIAGLFVIICLGIIAALIVGAR